jgi:hypothetical protein
MSFTKKGQLSAWGLTLLFQFVVLDRCQIAVWIFFEFLNSFENNVNYVKLISRNQNNLLTLWTPKRPLSKTYSAKMLSHSVSLSRARTREFCSSRRWRELCKTDLHLSLGN